MSQTDPDFQDIKFKNGTTMGSYGCFVFSIAMIACRGQGITSLAGKRSVVQQIVDDSTDPSGDFQGVLHPINGVSYTYRRYDGHSGAEETIQQQLSAGRPCIVQVPGHFVVVYGIDSSATGYAKYLVKDPGEQTNTHLQQTMNKYSSKIKSVRSMY